MESEGEGLELSSSSAAALLLAPQQQQSPALAVLASDEPSLFREGFYSPSLSHHESAASGPGGLPWKSVRCVCCCFRCCVSSRRVYCCATSTTLPSTTLSTTGGPVPHTFCNNTGRSLLWQTMPSRQSSVQQSGCKNSWSPCGRRAATAIASCCSGYACCVCLCVALACLVSSDTESMCQQCSSSW